MKKFFLFLLSASLLITSPLNSQSRFIRNVARDVKNDLLGSSGGNTTKNTQPEPKCACSSPEVVFSLEGKNLAYSEIGIDVLDNGMILIFDRIAGKYYLIKDGKSTGPFADNDPAVAPYINNTEEGEKNPLLTTYGEYVSMSGDKYIIKFNGKTYGPYAQVENFQITKSKDKFVATVVENVAVTQDQGKKMDEAMKKAKTDQERMELAMQFQQEMMQNMMANGGPQSSTPKLISNIEGVTFNPLTGGTINAKMKYDDILVNKFNSITDLKGNNIITIKPEHAMQEGIFVNSSNTAYASYASGTIYFSDGKTLSELFSPALQKIGGSIFLTYMYYSPAKNAIMQCKIPF